MSIGLMTAAALIPANPVPSPAPIPAIKQIINWYKVLRPRFNLYANHSLQYHTPSRKKSQSPACFFPEGLDEFQKSDIIIVTVQLIWF